MNVTVVGDLLLDVDVEGDVERLTPYAPVPVLDVVTETKRAGGAGLVATLLHRDGHDVTLVTALSDDARAAELPPLLDGITLVAGRSPSPTVVKTRIRSREQPIVRIDEGSGTPDAPEVTPAMLAAVAAADLVVVADYGRKLLEDPALRAAVAEAATRVPVVWDPHARGSQPVPGVVVTPNMGEARVFSGVEGGGRPVRGRGRAAPAHRVGRRRGGHHDGRCRRAAAPVRRRAAARRLRPADPGGGRERRGRPVRLRARRRARCTVRTSATPCRPRCSRRAGSSAPAASRRSRTSRRSCRHERGRRTRSPSSSACARRAARSSPPAACST